MQKKKSSTFCFSHSRCPSSHVGDRCQYTDPCNALPCMNGGTCVVEFQGTGDPIFRCECSIQWRNSVCELQVDNVCQNENLCLNQGRCNLLPDSLTEYTCACKAGFTGKLDNLYPRGFDLRKVSFRPLQPVSRNARINPISS